MKTAEFSVAKKLSRHRHHGPEILAHQIGIFADGLRDRHEDHAGFRQLFLEGRGDRDGIEHRVDRDAAPRLDACQHLLLAQRDAELLVGLENLRVDLVQGLRRRDSLRRGVVVDVVVIDLVVRHARPVRLLHGQPALIGIEAPLEHPLRLALLGRDEADHVLGEALRRLLHLDVGLEPVLILVDVDQREPGRLFPAQQASVSPTAHGFKGRGLMTWKTGGASGCARLPLI